MRPMPGLRMTRRVTVSLTVAMMILVCPLQMLIFWNVPPPWPVMDNVHVYGEMSPFQVRGAALMGLGAVALVFRQPASFLIRESVFHHNVGWASRVLSLARSDADRNPGTPEFRAATRIAFFNTAVWWVIGVGILIGSRRWGARDGA